jgi:eukaryotic-like serine/threonine-protein kinase
MTSDRWSSVQELFHQALGYPSPARAEFLNQACQGDEQLRGEVISLLAAHESEGPLGRLDDFAPGATPPLEWIGPYRLVRRLGEGGMGVVYLAERSGEGFSQFVALKLIRAGFADPRLQQRLTEERRLLARLEHPGIARLIDGGSTAAGQPYYAMEFVEGSNLLQYCAEHSLSAEARLKLFIQVCEAVHYAHQQLVLHRDIKPGNVWVTPDGHPKLLDFGLAKALEHEDHGDATQTAPWLTPAYAGPEQLKHGRVSILTDVYALGVMLYELVTGVRPYQVEGLSPADLTRVVCESVPRAPSAVANVAGDVSVIVLKALAKEPERRYGSAAELADDLRRYLLDEPVLARPDSLGYRLSKLVQRHKATVAAAIAVVVFLIGGLGAALWQARVASTARLRAEAALRQSEDVSEFMIGLFEASDPEAAFGDTLAARELLRRGVAEADRLKGQPIIQARLLVTLGRVYENLARYDDAERLYQRALAQRRAALGPVHLEVAENLDRLGTLYRRVGRYAAADSLYRAALDMKVSLLGPEDPAVAQTLYYLGFLMPYLGRLEEGESYYRRALAIQQGAQPPDPKRFDTMLQLATTLTRRGNRDEAEGLLRDALAVRTASDGADAVTTAEAKTYLADFLNGVRADHAGAERLYREALAVCRANPDAGINLLTHATGGLADADDALGKSGEAETLLRGLVDLQRERFGQEHPSVAWAKANLAEFLQRHGRLAEAEVLSREQIAIVGQALGPEGGAMAGAVERLATLMTDQGRYREADSLFKVAIQMREHVSGPQHPLVALALVDYADLLTRSHRFAESEAVLVRALEILEPQYPDTHPDTQRVIRGFVTLYERWNRPEQAARYRARVQAVGPGL